MGYNQGGALSDGGGHSFYLHHEASATLKKLLVESNCLFNDHGVACQLYDSSGANINHVILKKNIVFNSGQLNNAPNIGGADSTAFSVGGSTNGVISEITVDGNIVFWTDGKGNRAFDVRPNGSLKIGANVLVQNNYARTSGTGEGAIYIGNVIATTGSFTHQNNTYRVYRSDATHNGRVFQLQDAGNNAVGKNGQYGWSGNVVHRVPGVGGLSCGDETGSGVPFIASVTGVGGCRTEAQFPTDCGFSADTLNTTDPSVTKTFVVPRDKFEIGQGWAVYFNWGGLNPIPIDLSSILQPGETFVVHDMRDAFPASTPVIGPTVYNGGSVNFPNTQVADPTVIGGNPNVGFEVNPPATAPVGNVFLVRRTAAAASGGGGGGSGGRKKTNVNASSSSSSI